MKNKKSFLKEVGLLSKPTTEAGYYTASLSKHIAYLRGVDESDSSTPLRVPLREVAYWLNCLATSLINSGFTPNEGSETRVALFQCEHGGIELDFNESFPVWLVEILDTYCSFFDEQWSVYQEGGLWIAEIEWL